MFPIAYFDNNATTPMCAPSVQALVDACEVFGNPSSLHSRAKHARQLLAQARTSVAELLGALPEEVFFTSGGTESNNWALKGVVGARLGAGTSPGHILVSAIEHASILQVADYLQRCLHCEVTQLKPNREGIVDVAAIEAALRPDTRLVSIMLVNNEVGTIQPVRQIAALLRERGIHFHVDGVQAVGKIGIDVHALQVDSLSFSAHKFQGPKGIGGLYLRQGVTLEPLMHGGGQESGQRGGMEAVALIAAMGAAAREAQDKLAQYQVQVACRCSRLRSQLLSRIPGCAFNGPGNARAVAPNTLSLRIEGVRAEAAAALLDQKYGIQVSLGSACSNNNAVSLSHVLSAMGLDGGQISSTMRISIGDATTEDDIDYFVASLAAVVELLRKMSPTTEAATAPAPLPLPLPLDGAVSILHCLEHYAAAQGDQLAYVFLADGERNEHRLTYAGLRQRALRFAAMLSARQLGGKAALMLYPSGLEFVVALFGCLYAGVVAVPANYARISHHYQRLRHIVGNARAAAILTTEALLAPVKSGMLAYGIGEDAVIFLTEPVGGSVGGSDGSVDVALPSADVQAFLQYTSGSTGQPKGVMVTHGQLIANERAIQRCAGLPEGAPGGGWLPQYHDMGLIGTLLQPIALGGSYTFMQPLHFLQRPVRWLAMISRYALRISAVPNFALDLCLRIPPESLPADLGLSRLQTVFCGAEPVSADTVQRFNERFARYGLRPSAVQACYGLAEAPLIVSGGVVEPALRVLHLNREQLAEGKLVLLPAAGDKSPPVVCCGAVVAGHTLAIVDPHTHCELGEDTLGEIWFAGPSVASGYLGNERSTRDTFEATTRSGRGPFLRTGDLGFVHGGGLYVTGRLKELMIIRGRNFYPHDIEATITACLRPHAEVSAAVFHLDKREAKGLVVLIELGRHARFDIGFEHASGQVRTVVSQAHELSVRDIIFVGSGGIPRTSSGKIQRHRCEHLYVSGELDQHPEKRPASRGPAKPAPAAGLATPATPAP